jgi:hypothetical protein
MPKFSGEPGRTVSPDRRIVRSAWAKARRSYPFSKSLSLSEPDGAPSWARAELELIAAPRQANSDAAAPASYFAAFGFNVQTDAVNRLLVLLAVVVIECGAGSALAVGLSLSEHREQGVRKQVFANSRPRVRLRSARTPRTPAKKHLKRVPNYRGARAPGDQALAQTRPSWSRILLRAKVR